MPHNHSYEVKWDGHDWDSNHTALGSGTIHTNEHHDDHGGHHTQSFHDHIHEIAQHHFAMALKLANLANTATVTIRSVKYLGKEYGPSARRAFNMVFQAVSRRMG